MTKQDLQKELLEKVKPGTKPSHLKKLKRSKSADDIPKSSPLPTSTTPLTDTEYPYTTLINQQQIIEKQEEASKTKSDTIKLLQKKIDDLENKEKFHSQ